MSIKQTFYLAHTARGKLSTEASRSDHNLRLLVGHANLLDSLMIHLAEAEREQELWYNTTVQRNETRDYLELDEEEEHYGSLATDYDSDSSDEEEEEDDDVEYFQQPRPRGIFGQRSTTVIGMAEVDESYDEVDDDVDEDGLFSLTRTSSHRPPSLCSDLSDDEDEDSAPPSPPQPMFHHASYTANEKIAVSTTSYYDSPSSISNEHLHFFSQVSHPPIAVINSF